MKVLGVLLFVTLVIMAVEGKKDKCPNACTLNYDPICASTCECKCQTFGNQCALDVYKCQNPKAVVNLVRKGECPKKCSARRFLNRY